MIALGILVFALLTFFVSLLMGREDGMDKGTMATCITLTAWGSLVFGIVIGRFGL